MFNELKVFDGGINNLIAPHHINRNQGIFISNATIDNGEITSAKVPKDTLVAASGSNAVYYKAQDEVVTSAEDRFYVEWAGMLYWSNSAGKLKRYDGSTVLDIGGHTAPASAATAAATTAGLLEGDYTYAVTYTHNDLFESPPSDFTQITAAKNKVNITFTDTPPATATYRNVYRAGGLNPTFNFVARVPVAIGSYSDNIHDFDISRKELTTYNSDPAPENLDMLVEVQGTFFGAIGNKVHFSKEGQPEYWSDYNFVNLPRPVTGLGTLGRSVIAFTESEMYLISGSSNIDISIDKLPFSFGCKNKRTVKNIEGRLIWVASLDEKDVICVYDGSAVTVVNKLDKYINASVIGGSTYDSFGDETYDTYSFDILGATTSSNRYYLFMDGRTTIVDFESGPKIYYMTESISGAYSKDNDLFVIKDGFIHEYLPSFSTYRNISYRTGDIDNGDMTRLKSYRSVKINATGAYKVHVIVDDQNIMQMENSKDFLPSGTRGKTISFLIESNGYAKIKSIVYEYDLLKE